MSSALSNYNYIHCDVFATRPYSGNSLAVFINSEGLSGQQMLTITQELRHFESVFLCIKKGQISARVFDQFEELPFAGHPLIGAACALHRLFGADAKRDWRFNMKGGRILSVASERRDGRYFATLGQGCPEMLGIVDAKPQFEHAFNLDKLTDVPLEVISTGLKYLIVPVERGLEQARVSVSNLGDRLREVGADFAYLSDIRTFEGRHWNNDGIMEDVATGSAAGVVGAYAMKHGLVQSGKRFILKQGHFIGRPSEIIVTAYGTSEKVERVTVAGEVALVGSGEVIAP